MKNLLIIIGAPCSGKTNWIESNSLKEYCISIDDLRKNISSRYVGVDGHYEFSLKYDQIVWNTAFSILESRMERGLFTIIDATHTIKKYINIYDKLCDKYRYRLYGKLFKVDLDILRERNKLRPYRVQIPDEELEKHFERVNVTYIPKKIQLIDKIEETNEIVKYYENPYKNIWYIGDIHGCYSLLDDFLNRHYNKEDCFVFLGDLLDRGPENLEVLTRCIELSKEDNCVFIEGNHEKHLFNYANDYEILSKHFIKHTLPQIENISKKEIRKFLRKFRQLTTFSHNGREILACHGGIPISNCSFIPGEQLITGVGKYQDHESIAKTWNILNKSNQYMVHGHRNMFDSPIQNGNVFNLENKIYEGGSFRAVRFGQDKIETLEIPSNYMYESNEMRTTNIAKNSNVEMLRNSKNVKKKHFEDITSFSFSRSVFNKGIWNSATITARGIFINNKTDEIVARSYNKFFNFGERNNELADILKNIEYPVEIFKKENGFLGIVGIDSNGVVRYCSKSSLVGDFAGYVKEILYPHNEFFKLYPNYSFIFEIIDPIRDPHIIEYKETHPVLLDIVTNEFEPKFVGYEDLLKIDRFKIKEKLPIEVNNKAELTKVIEMLQIDQTKHEGYVICGSNDFRFKLKNPYYNLWKRLRKEKDRCHNNGYIITNFAHDSESIKFLSWCKKKDRDYIRSTDIITLRKAFEHDRKTNSIEVC